MRRLALDIGGTKFTLAAFKGENMARRETRSTDREGGREWLLAQLGPMIAGWHAEAPFEACGIGFGGPVLWDLQMVAKSTHVGGWNDFNLPAWVRGLLGDIPVAMDNDANAGALGEYWYGAGKGCSPLFYMTVSTGIGGGVLIDGNVVRGADSWAGEIGHVNVRPDGPACLCGSNGCLERMCCGLWLERDYGAPAKELFAEAGVREPLRGGHGAGLEIVHHAAEPRADRDRRRHRKGRRFAVYTAARGTGAPDAAVVACANRRGSGRAGR
jgi:glucokinase